MSLVESEMVTMETTGHVGEGGSLRKDAWQRLRRNPSALIGLTLVLQTILEPLTQGASIAVAASTLLTVALLQPVRARIQRVVDRRFDRTAIDHDRLLADFGRGLGNELDLSMLQRMVEGTSRLAVHPDGATLWLRPRAGRRR